MNVIIYFSRTVRGRPTFRYLVTTNVFVLTGVDDAESECGLDTGVTWDITVNNSDEKDELEMAIQYIMETVHLKMNTSGF